ncbi:MAG: transcription termination factor NusA [Phycisphaerae bacterium]|nr:transcription termination factor NusA [Phycisphaerae bacterium]
MNQDMLRIIDSIARDRNLEKESLFFDIEQAMVSAARKHFNADDTEDFSCDVDRMTGEITIARGGDAIPLATLGRIPAQTAKQVMIQKFREDERASIFAEFSERVGELVTGTAQRYEGGALVIQMGRAEGFMPRSEQIPGEQHNPGERVRCLILDVRDMGNQVKIVLSRGHADFIRRLFEVEVPEVAERIIELKGLAREPGHRTKVAVSSIDSKVDAVGACVGVRGSRIKNIVDELAGEKIDVVRWNDSSQVLIGNSLRPAEIVEISLCFELGRATVVVNEDQLSLAIGKRGQNVRLAARLTAWDVDILTPAEFQKGLDIMEQTVAPIEDVTEAMVDRLAALGIISVFDIEELGQEVLLEHLGEFDMTPELADRMVEICTERARQVAEEQQREREEAAKAAATEQQAAPAAGTAEQQAAAILGAGGAPAAAAAPAAAGGGDILDMLVNRAEPQDAGDAESAEPAAESGDQQRDVALAAEQAEAAGDPAAAVSPAEQEIEQAQDDTDVARIAEGSSGIDDPAVEDGPGGEAPAEATEESQA